MSDEAAVDQLLQREPRNIAALVDKADLRWAAGDDPAAAAFYKAALKAAVAASPLPLALKPIVERAQTGLARLESGFERYLERSLASAGFPAGRRPARFEESLALMFGHRHASLELQQPTSYYLPGLPQRRYYERCDFPWAAALEAEAPAIREELTTLAALEDRFTPYLVSDPSRPRSDVHGLVDNPEWSTLYIWERGGWVQEVAEHVPCTVAAIEKLDLARITNRAPSILFSRLRLGASIPPHHGVMNARLICHLPLIVPPGCGFRVGGETRLWREGELLVFDDTVEHEAWNRSSSDRIILIFDIWRPELSEDERRAVTALFEAVDSYSR